MHLIEFLIKLQGVEDLQNKEKKDCGTSLMLKFLWVADNVDFLDESYIQGNYIKLFLNITKEDFM